MKSAIFMMKMEVIASYLINKRTYRRFDSSLNYQVVIYSAVWAEPEPIDLDRSIYDWTDEVPKSPIKMTQSRYISFGATFDQLWNDVRAASNEAIAAATVDKPLVGQADNRDDNEDQFAGLAFQIVLIGGNAPVIKGKMFELLAGEKLLKSHLRMILRQFAAEWALP